VPKTTRRSQIHASIIEALKEERLRQGVSGNSLAARAGLNQSAISLLERGLRSPSLDTLLRICEALDVDFASVVLSATRKSKR
jgi:transcriptional regulator with XRE-family HTH domain